MPGSVGRLLVIVLDSVGIGEAPDADEYGDRGANTLGHVLETQKPHLPELIALGMEHCRGVDLTPGGGPPHGCFGKAMPASPGKDSITGHWELAGVILEKGFRTFPDGFPREMLEKVEKGTGLSFLGNKAASGTEIIKELGQQHQETRQPIAYTSADPVFQIAAHEEILPIEELYQACEITLGIVKDYGISRVIARPFLGAFPEYWRTERRRDYSVLPPYPTVLDLVLEKDHQVISIGKVSQLFGGRGFSRSITTKSNRSGIDTTIEVLGEVSSGLIFVNLIDFDMVFGHRRDPSGFARALEEFDHHLPAITERLCEGDLLIITADHGNDPTYKGTDHTRENVPLLTYSPGAARGVDLGTRQTFADVAATLARYFGVAWAGAGRSFLEEIGLSVPSDD
jgi:phosphopentomutase